MQDIGKRGRRVDLGPGWQGGVETFRGARDRLLKEFEALGWHVCTRNARGPLKVPHASSPGSWPLVRLYFKPQALYVSYAHGGTAHAAAEARSLVSDYRYANAISLSRLAMFYARARVS